MSSGGALPGREPETRQTTGSIVVNVFDGRRAPFADGSILVTVRDGNQHSVSRNYHDESSIEFQGLPVFHNFGDNYTVVASAGAYKDVGFYPVKVSAGQARVVDLLLLPKSSTFNFFRAKWSALPDGDGGLKTLFSAGLADNTAAARRYNDLMDYHGGAPLACMLNLVTAMRQALLPQGTALSYLKEIIWDRTGPNALAPDRFFAWADPAIISQLEIARQQGTFSDAPFILHPEATRSYKQLQFGEANLQLTLHQNNTKNVNGRTCIMIEPDMDYYKDSGAHFLLEVLVSGLGSMTDPRQVFALRWIAGRQAGIPEFDPLYTIDKA